MSTNSIVGLAFQASLFVVVFGLGLTARFVDLLIVLRRPGLLARSLLATVIVMPVLAVVAVSLLELRPAVEIALVALAISPLPPLLPRRASRAGGAAPFGLGLVTILAVLSIGLIPLAAQLLGVVFDRSYVSAPETIALTLIVAVVAPLASGMATREWLPALADRLQGPVTKAQVIFAPLAVGLAVVSAGSAIWDLIGNGTILAIVAFVVVGFVTGHLLGGPAQDTSAVLAFATACRHPATATTIASVNFPGADAHAAIVLYSIVTVLLGFGYASMFRRRSRDRPTS